MKLVQYDGIVAYDVARLSREFFDLAWLRKWAEANNKKLYVIKERLRWPDNRDGTLWGVAAERAYEERQDIIERVSRELTALRDAGKLAGAFPFGYASAGDKYDRYLVPTDTGREYVPLIFQHCIDGWSLNTIARWLDDEGIAPTSGGKWWAKTIASIIKNPTYMGHQCQREVIPPDEAEEIDGKPVRYRYGGTWGTALRYQYGKTVHRCEPLVDAAVWKHASEALSSRPKRGHFDPRDRAMLADAVFCSVCADSPMYRLKATGVNSRDLFYYRCSGRGSQRQGCGNMVRVELVDAAVNKIMARTFNVPVMRHEIVYGNEAELQAETERIKFELRQLPAGDLDWEEEDRERARLRAEQTQVANTTVVEDRVELVETDDTYLELWERQDIQNRGSWLIEHGFRVTATKERATVSQGDVSATVELGKPERITPTRHLEQTYWGKCGCGCGTDLYGVKCRRKEYANAAHRDRAKRRRAAAELQAQGEPEQPRKCECGCGADIYAASYATRNQKRYVNASHRSRGMRQRAAAAKAQAADPQEP